MGKQKGLLLVYTGNGKGKTTAALGLLLRAHGRGQTVRMLQFMKQKDAHFGEHTELRSLEIPFEVFGDGWTLERQLSEPERVAAALSVRPEQLRSSVAQSAAHAQAGWQRAKALLADPTLDLLVLDEWTHVLRHGWVDWAEAKAALTARPAYQHVVITGRYAPPQLLDAADTVTEMQDLKHAHAAGVAAQCGMEY